MPKRAMRPKYWREDTIALLMCSPIRPVPPIMRMFWEADMVSGVVLVWGWLGEWFWIEGGRWKVD